MDIKEFKKVKIVNIANARIVTHAFSLAHDAKTIINPNDFSEEILKDLNVFFERGQIQFIPVEDEPEKELIQKHTEIIETGLGKQHVVFKPQDRLINVEEIDLSGKAVEVGFNKMDAIDLLSKHWKSLEKEVGESTDVDKLNLLLSVAKEQEMTGKKLEIIKNRIGELV